ncbi:MAG: hypothetical protein CMN30_07220 [Sandaracinus sp.]|nr:hypothetical protein [Sandaracinus sp.]
MGQSGDWRIERRSENERTEVHRVRLGDAFATWELVAAGLRSDADLRAALTASLGSSDHEAFFVSVRRIA